MTAQTKTLLVLLSVTLNVAFAFGWGIRVWRSPAKPLADSAATAAASWHQQLGLSAEQQRQIEALRASFREAAAPIFGEMNLRRQELLELMAAPAPDENHLRDKQREIQAGQRSMQGLVLKQILAEKLVLSPVQQEQYFAALRQQSGRPGQGGIARWLQSGQTNRLLSPTNAGN